MSTPERRTYNSSRRRQGAEENRQRILAAAKVLFSRSGIDAVPVEEIAQAAGLSAPTIYATFKSKAGILHALMEESLFGARYRAEAGRLEISNDPVEMLAQSAAIARAIYDAESCEIGLLRGASAFSKTLRLLEKEFEKLRFDLQKARVEALFESGSARTGLDLASARQVLWMYTSRDVYRMLVIESKWSPDKYQAWLAETLVATLTDTPKPRLKPQAKRRSGKRPKNELGKRG